MKHLVMILMLALSVSCAKSGDLSTNAETSPGTPPPIDEPGTPPRKPTPTKFTDPAYTEIEKQAIYAKYSYIDASVPKYLLNSAVLYYEYNNALIRNRAFLTLVDFDQPSSVKRLYIIDMHSGAIWRTYVAHGSGSDPGRTGYAKTFSNIQNSYQSSLGFYYVNEKVQGTHGLSVLVDGLSKTNSKARPREIYLHSATYVQDTPMKQGMSLGCFVVPQTLRDRVMNALGGGSILYAYSKQLSN